MRYPRILLFAAAAAVILGSLSAEARDVKVIANTSVAATAVSADELRSVYLEQTSSLVDGSHVQPVLIKGGPAHEAFLKDVIDKTDSALQTYYRSLVFTGKGTIPKILESDSAVVAYVAKTKGAIGYVSVDTAVAGVKTLQVK